MTLEDLVQIALKVEEMRDLQKHYFATRDCTLLRSCRSAEQAVDRMLAKYHHQLHGEHVATQGEFAL